MHKEFFWDVSKGRHGFLPNTAPLHPLELPGIFLPVARLALRLPKIIHFATEILRDELSTSLPIFPENVLLEISSKMSERELECIFSCYCFIGHAFISAAPSTSATGLVRSSSEISISTTNEEQEVKYLLIPKVISFPWNFFSKIVSRPPVMSYATCVLNNWTSEVVHLCGKTSGNFFRRLRPTLTFTESNDEAEFYLTHLKIEIACGSFISKIAKQIDSELIEDFELETLLVGMKRMNDLVTRLFTVVSPSTFFNDIRRFLSSIDGSLVEFEGVEEKHQPRNQPSGGFGGASGAQSSLFVFLDGLFAIEHNDEISNLRLSYDPSRPQEHMKFLARAKDLRTRGGMFSSSCLAELITFRRLHVSLAKKYIAAFDKTESTTNNPVYVNFLKDQELATEETFHSKNPLHTNKVCPMRLICRD